MDLEALPDLERRLIERLQVFPESFTAEAAAAILDEDEQDLRHTCEGLAAGGLLTPVPGDGPARFALAEGVRREEPGGCALERPPLDEGEERLRRAHAGYYLPRLRAEREELDGEGREAAMRRLEPDLQNVLGAGFWAATADLDETEEQKGERLQELFIDVMLLGRAFQEAERYDAYEMLGMLHMVLAVQSPKDEESKEHLDWLQRGHEREEAGDWEGAIEAYHRAMDCGKGAQDEFQPRRNLSALHAAHGRYREALEEAERMETAARAMEMEILIAHALVRQALYRLRLNDLAGAAACCERAFQLTPAEDTTSRAQTLTVRARCRSRQGEVAAAREDLDHAWRLLAPAEDRRFLGGIQYQVLLWWEAAAEVRAGAGDVMGAVEALRAGVERSREIHHQRMLAEVLHGLGQALVSAGEPAAAEEALAESRQLRRSMHLPPLDH